MTPETGAAPSRRMGDLYDALIQVVYAATDDRDEAIGATAAALANFCGTNATEDERETSLLRAIVMVREVWTILDGHAAASHERVR